MHINRSGRIPTSSLLLLGAVLACADERASLPTGAPPVAQQIATQTIEARLPDGTIRSFSRTVPYVAATTGTGTSTSSDAFTVARFAVAASVTDAPAGQTRSRFADGSGARYELRFVRRVAGAPVERVEVRRNGQRFIASTYRWQRDGAGYRLVGERQDVYRDGILSTRATIAPSSPGLPFRAPSTLAASTRVASGIGATLADELPDGWGEDGPGEWTCDDLDPSGGFKIRSDHATEEMDFDECIGDWDEDDEPLSPYCESERRRLTLAILGVYAASGAVAAALVAAPPISWVAVMSATTAYFRAVTVANRAWREYVECKEPHGIR